MLSLGKYICTVSRGGKFGNSQKTVSMIGMQHSFIRNLKKAQSVGWTRKFSIFEVFKLEALYYRNEVNWLKQSTSILFMNLLGTRLRKYFG